MLRSDWVTFETLLRAVKPTVAQMPRGTVQIDSANLAANVADGTHLPDIMGLRLSRLASLGNGTYTYKDSAATEIATNV